jgi:hypothetical protein
MRTEGVIKVRSMMEGRIFDFDRQCGSRAGRFWFYLCLCTTFTLSLFKKRDRVAARRFRSSSPALVESLPNESKFGFLSAEPGLADDLAQAPFFFFFFFAPQQNGRLWNFPPSLASFSATKTMRDVILGILIPFAVSRFPCNPSAEVPYRVISTYLSLNKSWDNTALGVIVSPFGLFHSTAPHRIAPHRTVPYRM